MITKLFEIRDRATFVPAMAIKLDTDSIRESLLLQRAGFAPTQCHILLIMLQTDKCNYDPYNWGSRTMLHSHLYLEQNFDELKSGEVIDVEYILGETTEKKESELKFL